MHFSQLDETAIAIAQVVAPETKPLIPVNIRVERIGFTRNASNTPYIVYWVGDRRCCTFIKRRRFLDLVQVMLRLKYNIEERICTIVSSPDFGLAIKAGELQQYVPSVYVKKFFERYNKAAIEQTEPQQQCDCNDLYNMCLHQIAEVFQPRLEQRIRLYSQDGTETMQSIATAHRSICEKR